MELTVAKKLKGVVRTAVPGPIPAAARASHSASVPERAAHRVGYSQLRGGGLLKRRNRGPQDELLESRTPREPP